MQAVSYSTGNPAMFGLRRRLLSVILPAFGITLGLMLLMESLVRVDYVQPETVETRPIGRIIAEERDPQALMEHTPPEVIDVAAKPPPLPELKAQKGDIDIPTPAYVGSAPADPGIDVVSPLSLKPAVIPDRLATPLEPLVVSYPSRQLRDGIEGDCLVRFNVDRVGNPSNVQADCSSLGFEREAHRAVSRARFVPQIENGIAVEQVGVIYPINFRIQEN